MNGTLMRRILGFVATISLILLGILLLVALFLAWALGVGWLLGQIVPLTLFEGALLASVATLAVGVVAARILSGELVPVTGPEEVNDWFDEPIPFTRFYPSGEIGTVEDWFAFRLANEIYYELQERAFTEEERLPLEDTSMDLAETALRVLKHKPPGTKRVLISFRAMQKESDARQHESVDDELLEVAVRVTNNLLDDDNDLRRVITQRLWDEPVTRIQT